MSEFEFPKTLTENYSELELNKNITGITTEEILRELMERHKDSKIFKNNIIGTTKEELQELQEILTEIIENYKIKKSDHSELELDKKINENIIRATKEELQEILTEIIEDYKIKKSEHSEFELPKTLTEKNRIADLVQETMDSLKGKSCYEPEILEAVKAVMYKEKESVSKSDFASALVSKLKEDGVVKHEGELSSIQKGVEAALTKIDSKRSVGITKP